MFSCSIYLLILKMFVFKKYWGIFRKFSCLQNSFIISEIVRLSKIVRILKICSWFHKLFVSQKLFMFLEIVNFLKNLSCFEVLFECFKKCSHFNICSENLNMFLFSNFVWSFKKNLQFFKKCLRFNFLFGITVKCSSFE